MIWVVLLILAIIAAYFIYQGLRARHIARCQNDQRTREHVPESVADQNGQTNENGTGVHGSSDNATANVSGQPIPSPQDSPSLLYAERNAATDADSTVENERQASDQHTDTDQTQRSVSNTIRTDQSTDQAETSDSMDFTAETATLSSDEVGNPANSSEYDKTHHSQSAHSIGQSGSTVSQSSEAANTQLPYDQQQTNYATTSARHHSENDRESRTGVAAATAGVVAAGVAAAAASASSSAASQSVESVSHQGIQHNQQQNQQQYQDNISTNETQHSTLSQQGRNDGIDLELGDSTFNDDQELTDEHDELLDFGDLTADISEMLKELNLRESDSPRLEINETEYQQLKTGEPGEVKPEKIENVAGKLRNMLQ